MYLFIPNFITFLPPMLFLGESYKLKVHFDSEHAGFYEQLLVFQVESRQQSSDKFEIMRILEVIHWTSFSEEPLPTATTSVSDLQTMNWTPAKGYNKLLSCNTHVIYVSMLMKLVYEIIKYSICIYLLQI